MNRNSNTDPHSYAFQRLYGEDFKPNPEGSTIVETDEAAFFDSAPEGQNAGSMSSIEAALKMGLVQPTEDPAVLYIHGKGRMGVAEALAVGHLNAAALRIVQRSDNVLTQPVTVLQEVPEPPKPKNPLDRFAGTPVGGLLAALMAWRATPHDVDSQVALGEALETALASPR